MCMSHLFWFTPAICSLSHFLLPLTNLFFRPVCPPAPTYALPHTGYSRMFSITSFSSSITRRRKVYIYTPVCLPTYCILVITQRRSHHTYPSEDLDLGFPDDAGGDPIETRGSAKSSHRQGCNCVCRIDSKGQDQISQTNQRYLTRGTFFST